jgi:hypothetical protein
MLFIQWADVGLALQLAVLAVVFSDILMKPGQIFGWYGAFLEKLAARGPAWEYWVKPLGYCVRCFSGQLALWTYLLTHLDQLRYPAFYVRLFSFVALTIFLASLLSLGWSKLTKHRSGDNRFQECRPEDFAGHA